MAGCRNLGMMMGKEIEKEKKKMVGEMGINDLWLDEECQDNGSLSNHFRFFASPSDRPSQYKLNFSRDNSSCFSCSPGLQWSITRSSIQKDISIHQNRILLMMLRYKRMEACVCVCENWEMQKRHRIGIEKRGGNKGKQSGGAGMSPLIIKQMIYTCRNIRETQR